MVYVNPVNLRFEETYLRGEKVKTFIIVQKLWNLGIVIIWISSRILVLFRSKNSLLMSIDITSYIRKVVDRNLDVRIEHNM